ncbi:MAG: hypothetical protein QW291_00795 [Thermofilaceae archaeon]
MPYLRGHSRKPLHPHPPSLTRVSTRISSLPGHYKGCRLAPFNPVPHIRAVTGRKSTPGPGREFPRLLETLLQYTEREIQQLH